MTRYIAWIRAKPLTPGDKLGPLAAIGMGEVFKASDAHYLGRFLVLKPDTKTRSMVVVQNGAAHRGK